MARPSAYLDFLKDPDQTSRRAELAAFIGPNAQGFLQTYDGLQSKAMTPKGQKPAVKRRSGFIAMAFFLGPCWFFYRRMWAWAWGLTAFLVVLGLLPITSRIGLPVGILLAVLGRQFYLQHAISRITKLRTGDLLTDLEPITRAGGVSKPAGWISGVVLVLLAVLGIAALIYLPDTAAGGATPVP